MNKIMYFFAWILSAIALVSCAGTPIVPIEERSMQIVHEIDLTKNEIYGISLEWMAQTLSDSREVIRGVIEYEDKGNGKIIGHGVTSFTGKVGLGKGIIPCRFKLTIEARDNKYRTTYSNFVSMVGLHNTHPEALEEKKYVDAVKAKLAVIDDDLYNYLNKYKSNTTW